MKTTEKNHLKNGLNNLKRNKIMTPKEKAYELVNKFLKPIDGLHKYPMCFDTAKQCALIAVDEILSMGIMSDSGDFRMAKSYWEEVKQEIKKL